MKNRPSAEEIIAHYNLKPLPVEGGLFCRTYLSKERIPDAALPDAYNHVPHYFGTAIYALMTTEPNSFSAMHKLPTDEIYHFYLGDPLEMLLLYPDGRSRIVLLGQDVFNDQHVQLVVPAGVWQGFHLLKGGQYGLIGTTMAPGFDITDYQGGEREELIKEYPDRKELITMLTRPNEPLFRGHRKIKC